MRHSSLLLLSIFSYGALSCYGDEPENRVCLPPGQLTVSHNFGRGVGHKGYTSADFFYIQSDAPLSPFADFRLHVMNEGRIALNAGLGVRALTAEDKFSLGANVYYDYRNSPELRTQQAAFGIEFLSEHVDFRFNGYLPVAGDKHKSRLKFARFSGNTIRVDRNTYYAFPTANAEIGIPVPGIYSSYVDVYVGIGPYYLFGDTISGARYPNSWGGKFRLLATFTDYLGVEFEINHDKVYHTTYQGVVALNIPLNKKRTCRGCSSSKKRDAYFRRTLEPVMRNEIIPLKKKKIETDLKDSNGTTIQAFFVNNQAVCPGLGTFESPFCDLAGASVAPSGPVVIYVFEGNSPTTPYSGPFTMKNGQTLQGSAFPLSLNGVVIPPMTTGNPIVTNVAGSAVILDNNTTVNGLTIRGTSNSGILGVNVADFTITNNTIESAGLHGIDITNHPGGFLIAHNIVSNPAVNGISVDASTFPGLVQIIHNTLLHAPGSGVLIRLDHPDAVGIVAYNNFSSNVFGQDIGAEAVQGEITISWNQIDSATEFGIHSLDGKQFITNNQVRNTAANSTAIFYASFAGISPCESYIYNNQATAVDSTSFGIWVETLNPGVPIYTEVKGNTSFSGNPTAGIIIRTNLPATICTSVTGNRTNTIQLARTAGPINVQETQVEYYNSNITSVGFIEPGAAPLTFGSSCTAP